MVLRHTKNNIVAYICAGCVFVLQMLDVLSTVQGLRLGAREVNPLMAPLVQYTGLLFIFKFIVAGGLMYATWRRPYAALFVILLTGYVVFQNYQIIYHLTLSAQ